MVSVNIIINQTDAVPGQAGVSRDDLVINKTVTLTNEDDTDVTKWKWEFISWPKTNPTQTAPTLTGSSSDSCSFVPTLCGTYILKLTVNDRVYKTIGAGIKTDILKIRIPASKETTEYPGNFEYSLTNVIKTIEENVSNDRILIFSSDTQYSESGSSYVEVMSFRFVIDSEKIPSSYRFLIGLRSTGITTAYCKIEIGSDLEEISISETSETIISGNIECTEVVDTILNSKIYIKNLTGGVTYIKYVNIYAVYATPFPR